MFDIKNLRRLKILDENAPDAMKAFWAFDKAAFAAGALTVQQKQLLISQSYTLHIKQRSAHALRGSKT